MIKLMIKVFLGIILMTSLKHILRTWRADFCNLRILKLAPNSNLKP
jgi:hypothetical protein